MQKKKKLAVMRTISHTLKILLNMVHNQEAWYRYQGYTIWFPQSLRNMGSTIYVHCSKIFKRESKSTRLQQSCFKVKYDQLIEILVKRRIVLRDLRRNRNTKKCTLRVTLPILFNLLSTEDIVWNKALDDQNLKLIVWQ